MDISSKVESILAEIAEVAGWLWQKGWAERNGGNLSVNLTGWSGADEGSDPPGTDPVPLPDGWSGPDGMVLYLTGAGRRMRDVARSPLGHGTIIRLTEGGRAYQALISGDVPPTSELPSHLAIHGALAASGTGHRAVLHTHPDELIALTHCPSFRKREELTRRLWSMMPEVRIVVPRGTGFIPYLLTGSPSLASATVAELECHEVVVWEKHGVLATGNDLTDCFDRVDTLNKAARIWLLARTAGCEPEGISPRDLDELAKVFGLPR